MPDDEPDIEIREVDPNELTERERQQAAQLAKPSTSERPTVKLDPTELGPSWPLALAMLEKLGPWTTQALRLGTLSLTQQLSKPLADIEAPAILINDLRVLTEALAKMPWEKRFDDGF